jgi:hypothetical protein
MRGTRKIRGARSGFGEIVISHKGHPITTTVGSITYEDQFGGDFSQVNFVKTDGNIPNGFQHRPDLISNLFFNNPSAWWLICERNAIFDVFEQLNPGDEIKIPVKL